MGTFISVQTVISVENKDAENVEYSGVIKIIQNLFLILLWGVKKFMEIYMIILKLFIKIIILTLKLFVPRIVLFGKNQTHI